MKIAVPLVLPLAAAIVLTITLPSCSKEAKKERSMESAMEYFQKGDYAAAEIEFKNTLDSDPGNPEAIKRLGLIRERQGASYEALGILNHVKDKLPDDDEVGVTLAKALLGLGFIPDSREQLFKVLDRTPSDGEALVLLAESSVTPEWMDEAEARIKKSGKKTTSTRLASALIELRRGSLESGEVIVEEVLQSDPKSARAHALKGSILSSKKQPEAALAELKIAADLAGSRSNESIAYARTLMSLNRRDEAVAYLEKITKDTSDFLPAWAMLGQIAFSEKNDEEATKHFTLVLSKNPVDMNSAMMLAGVFTRGKQADKAIEVLEKVSSTLPSRPQLELALAKACISAEKVAKAAGALDRALPKEPAARDQALASAPVFTEIALLRAQIYLQDNQTAEAVDVLEAIRKREPKDEVSRDLLIRAYRNAGRNDAAIALLREKAGGDDQEPSAQVELGQLLVSQGKLDEARSIFEQTIQKVPGNLAAVSNLAGIDFREGKTNTALRRLDEYIVAHPDSSEAYTLKAGVELGLKNSAAAEKSLVKAIELKADNAQAYGLLLQIKSGAGQQEEALRILDEYLKAFPNDAAARLQRGYVLQQLGRNDDARAAFTALIEANPEFAAAYNNLAALESEEFGNLEVAAGHARKARSLDPSQPAIADTLGWIEWRLGNYSAALPLLTEAAEKMSNNPEVLYHYAMARYSMGQAAEATTAFQAVLAKEGDFPQKADAQKFLTLLDESGKATIADLEVLKKRVAENPKDVMAHLQVSELLARSGRPQEALEAYKAAFAANPAIPTALIGQARLYAGPLNSPEEALKAATAARELAPRDPNALAALGSAKLLAGTYEEAYGILKDAAAALESDWVVLSDYARSAYSLGRVQEAVSAMTRVASSDASVSADARSFLLLTGPDALKAPGIAEEVGKALVKNPQNVAALMVRGSLETAAGKNPEATYLEVLKLHPRFDPARVRLAGLYVEDPKKLDQALLLASEARSRMSDDPELTRIFAIGNYRKGDFKYAAQLMSELSIKRALAPDELFLFGMSLANAKQRVKAREILEQAIRAGLPDADAATAKETLSKLDEPKEEK